MLTIRTVCLAILLGMGGCTNEVRDQCLADNRGALDTCLDLCLVEFEECLDTFGIGECDGPCIDLCGVSSERGIDACFD